MVSVVNSILESSEYDSINVRILDTSEISVLSNTIVFGFWIWKVVISSEVTYSVVSFSSIPAFCKSFIKLVFPHKEGATIAIY